MSKIRHKGTKIKLSAHNSGWSKEVLFYFRRFTLGFVLGFCLIGMPPKYSEYISFNNPFLPSIAYAEESTPLPISSPNARRDNIRAAIDDRLITIIPIPPHKPPETNVTRLPNVTETIEIINGEIPDIPESINPQTPAPAVAPASTISLSDYTADEAASFPLPIARPRAKLAASLAANNPSTNSEEPIIPTTEVTTLIDPYLTPQNIDIPESISTQNLFENGEFQISFNNDETIINDEANLLLERLAWGLTSNPQTRIELLSYANGTESNLSQTRRLSLNRARIIRNYLTDKGIDRQRIIIRALGDAGTDQQDYINIVKLN